ncbi:MAG: hypothetical protein ACKVYV_11135 [Limisphaerales bacterium]
MTKYTVCDPLIPYVVDKGLIAREAILPTFRDFPWESMLAKMRTAKEEDIHFSPSVSFTNLEDLHSMTISIVEDPKETVFYLFYAESEGESSTHVLLDQSAPATSDILAAFADGRYYYVRERCVSHSKPWWKLW